MVLNIYKSSHGCPAEGEAECRDWMQLTHRDSHTQPILRIDSKWSEKEKHPSKQSRTVSQLLKTLLDQLVLWEMGAGGGREWGRGGPGRVCRYLWPPAADPFYTLSATHCRRTPHLFNWRPRCLVPVHCTCICRFIGCCCFVFNASITFFFTAECFAMLSRERLFNQLSCFFPLFFEKNLFAYKSCWRAHGMKNSDTSSRVLFFFPSAWCTSWRDADWRSWSRLRSNWWLANAAPPPPLFTTFWLSSPSSSFRFMSPSSFSGFTLSSYFCAALLEMIRGRERCVRANIWGRDCFV